MHCIWLHCSHIKIIGGATAPPAPVPISLLLDNVWMEIITNIVDQIWKLIHYFCRLFLCESTMKIERNWFLIVVRCSVHNIVRSSIPVYNCCQPLLYESTMMIKRVTIGYRLSVYNPLSEVTFSNFLPFCESTMKSLLLFIMWLDA